MKQIYDLLKNRIFSLMIVCLLCLVQMQTLSARGLLVELEKPRVGVVTKIIDTEAVEVMYYSTLSSVPTIERIKLVGVNSMASDDSLEYSKNQLLGKTVFVVYDTQLKTDADGYRPAYLYINTDQSFNETLLQFGYGVFDTTDNNALYKIDLLKAEQIAKRQELNMWQTASSPVNKVNINLASLESLMEHFDFTSTQANDIINYRKNNAINSLEELGFVLPAFNRDFLQNQGRSVHFVTDINSASLYELTSLFSTFSSLEYAYKLNDYRVFQPLTSLASVKSLLTLTSTDYSKLELFSTLTPNNNLYLEPLKKKVNVNTATLDELQKASSMNLTQATTIVNLRNQFSYTFRSLEELCKYNLVVFPQGLTYYTDDLQTMTNINTANLDELMSLFSKVMTSETTKAQYAKKIMDLRPFYDYSKLEQTVGFAFYKYIQPYIFIDEVPNTVSVPININTAAKSKIISYLGLNASNSTQLLSRSTRFSSPQDVFFMNASNASKVTLYTNLNTASVQELLLMHYSMTQSLANKIVNYRIEFPFYQLSDIASLLEAEDRSDLYTIIKNYVVFY